MKCDSSAKSLSLMSVWSLQLHMCSGDSFGPLSTETLTQGKAPMPPATKPSSGWGEGLTQLSVSKSPYQEWNTGTLYREMYRTTTIRQSKLISALSPETQKMLWAKQLWSHSLSQICHLCTTSSINIFQCVSLYSNLFSELFFWVFEIFHSSHYCELTQYLDTQIFYILLLGDS